MTKPKTRGRNVLFRLYILGQLTNDLVDSAMVRSKLNPNDFAVQSAIRAYQPITPSQLSTLLGTPPTTLSSQLARLERRKQIKRRRNPDDGRSSLIELTKQGEKNYEDRSRSSPNTSTTRSRSWTSRSTGSRTLCVQRSRGRTRALHARPGRPPGAAAEPGSRNASGEGCVSTAVSRKARKRPRS
jgi:DNA-binding MarR family transcriptional regulator